MPIYCDIGCCPFFLKYAPIKYVKMTEVTIIASIPIYIFLEFHLHIGLHQPKKVDENWTPWGKFCPSATFYFKIYATSSVSKFMLFQYPGTRNSTNLKVVNPTSIFLLIWLKIWLLRKSKKLSKYKGAMREIWLKNDYSQLRNQGSN